jgi:hypothetical protein
MDKCRDTGYPFINHDAVFKGNGLDVLTHADHDNLMCAIDEVVAQFIGEHGKRVSEQTLKTCIRVMKSWKLFVYVKCFSHIIPYSPDFEGEDLTQTTLGTQQIAALLPSLIDIYLKDNDYLVHDFQRSTTILTQVPHVMKEFVDFAVSTSHINANDATGLKRRAGQLRKGIPAKVDRARAIRAKGDSPNVTRFLIAMTRTDQL